MYLKQIFRSISRDLLNTGIMILSLAVGIFCAGLILTFINYELGTDKFHKDKDNIYALNCDDPFSPGQVIYYCLRGSAEYMKTNYSSVEDYCRVNSTKVTKVLAGDQSFFDNPLVMATSENFFSFFSYELVTHNPETVLESKNNIVISTELAEKYFDTDPLGKIITLENGDKSEEMVVTGIFKKSAYNTQLKFDMVRLIPESDSRCYIKLKPATNPEEFEKTLLDDKKVIPVLHMGNPGPYYLTPLRKAYFDTKRATIIDKSRNVKDLWIAGSIGFLIVGIAIFNYLGILANKFQRKTREFFIRRINGSPVSDLANRFLLENSIILFLAFFLALALMPDLMSFFNSMINGQVPDEFVFHHRQMIVFSIFFVTLLIITLVFTVYILRSNSNLFSLKTDYAYKLKGIYIPFFNIFQIAASIVLIICSLVIIRQINFIEDKPIGLDKNVIEVKIPDQYKSKASVFKDELLKYTGIRNVSIVEASPVLEHFQLGLSNTQDGITKDYFPAGFSGDEDYFDVLSMRLIEGNGFIERTQGTKICVINQTFAGLFPDRNLVGQKMPGLEDNLITGIVEDFNYNGLESEIGPAFISLSSKGGHLLVKAADNFEARKAIGEVWGKLIPDFPVDTESIGERFAWFHRDKASFRKLLITCSLISLFLSIIGLLAITYQKAIARTKEIGIRRINGANNIDVLVLINKGFLTWTIIAFLFALPVSWYATNKWLQGFAYRTNLPWWIFLIGGVITLLITLITVNSQVRRVARRNPVEALRSE
ncbi:MAG TPA: ABC transporter permease [Bacteroidales bacterium]|nr:ABC transporter permease [Bacteroidales bacterium]